MEILLAIIVFMFGTVIGSFLNVLTLRLPAGHKASGRSYCPHCRRQLRALDLVPLASFIFLLGRCRHCKYPISFRYPLVELATGLLFLFAYFSALPVSLLDYFVVARLLFCVAVCIVVFIIDFEHYLILDRVILSASAVMFGWNVALDIFIGHFSITSFSMISLVCGLVGYVFIWLLWKTSQGRWIGLGDAKLLLFLGLVLGFPSLLVAFLLALALGTIVSLALLVTNRKTMKSQIPFGTFLVVGAYVALLYGQSLWQQYLVFMGFS